jgi:hypothetical protein
MYEGLPDHIYSIITDHPPDIRGRAAIQYSADDKKGFFICIQS